MGVLMGLEGRHEKWSAVCGDGKLWLGAFSEISRLS